MFSISLWTLLGYHIYLVTVNRSTLGECVELNKSFIPSQNPLTLDRVKKQSWFRMRAHKSSIFFHILRRNRRWTDFLKLNTCIYTEFALYILSPGGRLL